VRRALLTRGLPLGERRQTVVTAEQQPKFVELFEAAVREVRASGEPELAEAIDAHLHVLNRLKRGIETHDHKTLGMTIMTMDAAHAFAEIAFAMHRDLLGQLGADAYAAKQKKAMGHEGDA